MIVTTFITSLSTSNTPLSRNVSPTKNQRFVMTSGDYHVKYCVRNSLDKTKYINPTKRMSWVVFMSYHSSENGGLGRWKTKIGSIPPIDHLNFKNSFTKKIYCFFRIYFSWSFVLVHVLPHQGYAETVGAWSLKKKLLESAKPPCRPNLFLFCL